MKRHSSRHSVLAALAVMAVILVAGGAAIASNAGFKFNMPIVPLSGLGGQQGHNWVGIPYFNPYATWNDFCTACGLTNAQATIQTIDDNGQPDLRVCGFANRAFTPGEGFRVTEPNPAVQNCIVVGSHDPNLSINLPVPATQRTPPNNVAAQGKFWFAVPYHATAATRDELCIQMGINDPTSVILSIDAVTGAPTAGVCGFAPQPLVLGQALQISPHTSGISFTPAHF